MTKMIIYALNTISAGYIGTIHSSAGTLLASCTFGGGSGYLTATLSASVTLDPTLDYWFGLIAPTAGSSGLAGMIPDPVAYSNSAPLFYASPSTITAINISPSANSQVSEICWIKALA